MLAKRLSFCLLTYFVTSISITSAQSVMPSTLNMGGGTYEKGNYYLDWSIGENISTETFQSNGNLIVTSGVLQPFTASAGVQDYKSHPWSKEELDVYPIPTHTIVELDLKISEKGSLTMQVFDQRGRIVYTRRFEFDGTNGKQKIDLTNIRPGVYYLNVVMGGSHTDPIIIRNGTFKIQKL